MGFALSQEGDTVKLFISNVSWTKLYPLLNNETVTVKLFGVWMEASFQKNQSPTSGRYVTVKLRNQTLPLNNIIGKLVEKNPLKKFKWIDKDEVLKFYAEYAKSFEWKEVKDSYSAEEIWSNLVEAYANSTLGVVEVDIETSEFLLKYEELAHGFSFTFFNWSKLISVCDSIKELFSTGEWSALQDAIKTRQSYATSNLKSDFKLAGNVNRMVYFIRRLKKHPYS
jgi:hypothetical protein